MLPPCDAFPHVVIQVESLQSRLNQ
jgi:hypothetical protein